MSKENEELVRKYPFLLPRNAFDDSVPEDYNYDYTILDSMPNGWRIAFGKQFCEELAEALNEDCSMSEYRVLQVKEKWGFLHWYASFTTNEIERILKKYEELSARTCIICGAPATKISRGWISPYCDRCAEKLPSCNNFDEIDGGENDLS